MTRDEAIEFMTKTIHDTAVTQAYNDSDCGYCDKDTHNGNVVLDGYFSLTNLAKAAYDALVAAGVIPQWRDIKDAPRDGCQFLVTDGSCVVIGETPDGLLFVHDVTSCGMKDITHFMPLHNPPTQEGK